MKIFSLMFVLAAVPACHDKTTLEPVTITNWPCATGELVTPIVVEARGPYGGSSMLYTGGASTQPQYNREIWLDKDVAETVTFRIGECGPQSDNCRNPRWLGDEQRVDIDTRVADPKIAIAFPYLACRHSS